MSALGHRANDVVAAVETTLKAWPALATIPVYNGQDPMVYENSESIAVAASENPDGAGEVVRFKADWVTIGSTRAEEGEITCLLIVQRGEQSATAKVVRDRASAILSEVEQALHSNRGQLGGLVPGLLWVTVSEVTMTAVATAAGQGVQVRFTVAYKGRFGPNVS